MKKWDIEILPSFIKVFCIQLLLIFISISGAKATTDTFYISENFKKQAIDQCVYSKEDKLKSLSVQEAISADFKKSKFTPFNAGFTGSDYWFKIHLKNLSDRSSRFLLELSNPSINLIHCYIIDHNNKLDTLPVMGDRLPFNTRSILANTFLYSLDIPYQESLTLIIRISNDYRQLHVPFKLWSNNFYMGEAKSSGYLWGSVIGFIILFLSCALIACLFARSLLLIFYFLYTVSLSLYILSMKGLGFQLIWPLHPTFQSYSMELFKYATSFFFIPFVILFFKTKVQSPVIHKMLLSFLIVFILEIPIRLLYTYSHLISPSFIMMITQLTSIGLILGDGLIWFIAWESYQRDNKWESMWVLGVCTMLFINLILMVSLHLGWIPGWNWVENFLVIGFFTEIIILSIVLINRYFSLYKSNYQLALDLSKAKESAIHNFLDGQNEERKRLSEHLHDSISLSLANIKMRLSHVRSITPEAHVKEIITPLLDDIGQTSKEVRDISHALSPLILKRGTLENALEDLAHKTQWAYPDIKIHWRPVIPESSIQAVPDNISQQMYYIASELINNATKHAKAHEIYIDYLKENHWIELQIKDDGIGYEISKTIKGLGLEHIFQRVKLLNGLFEVKTGDPGMLHTVRFTY